MISPVQRGPKTSWAEWDVGGVTWRAEMIERDAQRRIATQAVTTAGTMLHMSVVRGRSSSVSPAASAWGTPVTADTEVIQIPGYSVVEIGYGYRQADWSVTARGGYGWYGQSLDGVRTHQWIQSVDGSYTVREGFRIEPSLTIQAGHFDLPAVGVRTEYRAPAEDGDISVSIGCRYGYGYSGLMESGGTEAQTAIRWQPSTTLWSVQPALRLETIYFRMRDRPRPEASPEELVALLSLQLTGRSSGSWTDAVTGWLPGASPE
jgi:hypothetical protein